MANFDNFQINYKFDFELTIILKSKPKFDRVNDISGGGIGKQTLPRIEIWPATAINLLLKRTGRAASPPAFLLTRATDLKTSATHAYIFLGSAEEKAFSFVYVS